MVAPADNERDCTVFCRSTQHAAQAIDCVLASRNFTLDQVKVYLRHLCWNFHCVTDFLGRTVLHAAASVGNVELIKWLIDVYGCDPDQVDAESGWGSLHRAAFFGHLGALWVLLQREASVDLKDHDGFTPLDLIVRDRWPWVEYKLSNPCGLNYWGEDENSSLGLGGVSISEAPKEHPKFSLSSGIHDAVIEKFHSVFLTKDNKVFVCGQGPGGRLGVPKETDLMVPEEIPLFRKNKTKVIKVAAAQDHTLFLDREGTVYSCGSNTYFQLGHPSRPDKLVEPSALISKTFLLKAAETINGVGAGKYHSVLFTERALYSWGLNAGQLGHPKQGERYTIVPRKVSAIDLASDNPSSPTIFMVSCAEGAIGVLMTNGDIYLVHDYHVKKVVSKLKGTKKIVVVGGNVDYDRFLGDSSKSTDLKLVTLNENGYIFLWEGRELLHSRVCLGLSVLVEDFALSRYGGLLLVSKTNEVFHGKLGRSVSSVDVGWSSKSKSKKHCSRSVEVDPLMRVQRLHRAVAVRCDPRGKRFVALQNGCNANVIFDHEVEEPRLFEDLSTELENDNLWSDVVVSCNVPSRKDFNLHSVVLCTASKFFKDKIMSFRGNASEKIHIEVSDIDSDAFSGLVHQIYSKRKSPPAKHSESTQLWQRFKVHNFSAIERDYRFDVQILCSDGQKINAHRCILAARCEYFKCMFSQEWQESSSRQLTMPVPSDIMMAIIEYIYTDTCPTIESSCDINFVCDIVIFADQLLLPRLKSICVIQLLTRFVNIDNVCELFEFGKCYRAYKLSKVCADFICINLTAVLESEYFDILSASSLESLSLEYQNKLQELPNRTMRGFSDYLSENHISDVYETFKDVFKQDEPLIKSAENQRRLPPKKPKVLFQARRRFNLPREIKSVKPSEKVAELGDDLPAAEKRLQKLGLDDSRVSPGEFPQLGEVESQKKQSKTSPMIIRQVPQSVRKRARYHSMNATTPTTPESITNCPWSPENLSKDKDVSIVQKSQSLEETMQLEMRYKEHVSSYSLAKAEAEDAFLADLAVIYEVGYNPDERVTIVRLTAEDASAPVWSIHPFK